MAEILHADLAPTRLELVAAWIGGQRWYAAKGATPRLRLVDSWRLDDPAGRVGIETLILADDSSGSPVFYQVPVTDRGSALEGADAHLLGTTQHSVLGTRWVYDGPRDPVYAEALLDFVQGRSAARSGTASGAPEPRFAATTTQSVPLTVRSSTVLSGEQSNTSVIYDTVDDLGEDRPVIVKLFRMLAPGLNPDVVLQSALQVAGCRRVPEVIGSVAGEWHEDENADATVAGHLALAQEFLPGVEDAWRVALRAVDDGGDFTGPARALGSATAEVHTVLADVLGTEETTPVRAREMVTEMRTRLDAAVAAVPELEAHRSAIEAVLDAALDARWPALQRIHGDYHLGQVLHSPTRGWILLDFEGEPLRPLAERTRPDQWVRDVAGMLRSFDYAGGSWEQDNPGSARAWVEASRGAFLEGYTGTAGHDPRDLGPLLAAFELDKAVYEVVYEARNRPGWLAIPLGAVTRLTGAADVAGEPTAYHPSSSHDREDLT